MKTKNQTEIKNVTLDRNVVLDLSTFYVRASFKDKNGELQLLLVDICYNLKDAKKSALAYKNEHTNCYVFIKEKRQVSITYKFLELHD